MKSLDTGRWQQLAKVMPELPLSFNAPLSDQHATDLIHELPLHDDSTILDLGCGWADFLLRSLVTQPGATGLGIDRNRLALERARKAAAKRGLRDRTTFTHSDLVTYSGPLTSIVFAVGIGQTTASPKHTLKLIKDRLLPGGSALYADGYWKRHPTAVEQAVLGNNSRELGSLDDVRADAAALGFDVSSILVADDDELRRYAIETRIALRQRMGLRYAIQEQEVIDQQESLWVDLLQAPDRGDHVISVANARAPREQSATFHHAGRFEWSQFPGHGPGVEIFGPLAGKRVLELGCGTGGNAVLLARQGAVVTGVDLAIDHIARARLESADLDTRLAFANYSAEDFLATTDRKFDCIYSVFGAVSFVDPHVLLPLVRQCLVVRGRLIFSVRHPERDGSGPPPLTGKVVQQRLPVSGDSVRRFDFGRSGWIEVLSRHGFEVDQILEISAPRSHRNREVTTDGHPCCLLIAATMARAHRIIFDPS